MKIKYSYAALAGLVLPLGFSPGELWGVSVLSLCTLIYLLENLNSRQSFYTCFFYGLGYWLSGISWVYVSIHYHGNLNIISSSLITILFICCLSLYTGMVGLLYKKLSISHSFNAILIFPICWFLVEIIRGYLFTGFPWLLVGTTLSNSFLDGWISVIGSQGNSLILTTLSGCILVAFRQRKNTTALLPSALIISFIVLSSLVLKSINWTSPLEEIKVTVYQPNLTLKDKWSYEGVAKTKTLMEASINEAEKSELVVFPETALIQTQEELKNWISDFDKKAKDKGVLFITGIIARNEEEKADNKMRNRILGLGAAEGYYDKNKLVPFGEFVPLESYIGNLLDFMGLNLTNTVSGNEYSLIKGKDLLLAPSICYEIAFSGIINETAKNANILVTISNDTWFGDSLGPIQHLEIAQDRALEHQKPVIRSTNSGISAIIDNKGIIKTKLGHFEGDRISSIVTSYQGRTPFTYIGNFLSFFYVLIILGVCIIKRTKVL